jgi:hypothetical protein
VQDAEERAAKEQEKMAAAYEKELAAEKCVPYSVDCWKVVLVVDPTGGTTSSRVVNFAI